MYLYNLDSYQVGVSKYSRNSQFILCPRGVNTQGLTVVANTWMYHVSISNHIKILLSPCGNATDVVPAGVDVDHDTLKVLTIFFFSRQQATLNCRRYRRRNVCWRGFAPGPAEREGIPKQGINREQRFFC